ncbi:MAG: EamA family transporter, partial [Planctomycetes bacterium]|nr:EamA family transporter [Planctomycetota bacterium]
LGASMQMLAAGIALLILGTFCGEWSRFDVSSVTLKSILSIVYLSLFGSILAFSCYLWLLRVTTASRVATYAYVNPLVAIVLGAVFLSEPLTTRALIAAIAIILAVVMINLSKSGTVAPAARDRNSSNELDNRVGSSCEGGFVQRAAKVVECLPGGAAQPCDSRSSAGLDH